MCFFKLFTTTKKAEPVVRSDLFIFYKIKQPAVLRTQLSAAIMMVVMMDCMVLGIFHLGLFLPQILRPQR